MKINVASDRSVRENPRTHPPAEPACSFLYGLESEKRKTTVLKGTE